MKTLATTSKILLVVAALGLSVAGCERRATDQGGGAAGTSGSSGSMGSSGSSGSPGSTGSTSGTSK